MPLSRTPEPPMPDASVEAFEYQQMDHSEVNRKFIDELLAGGETGFEVIDLGCGPAQIAIELCRRDASYRVMGIDAEIEMLELAKMEIDMAGMLDQITLAHADATSMDEFEDEMADLVMSNSLIHHLDDPIDGLKSCVRLVRPGGRLFVRDLARPDSEAEVESLVEAYTEGESEFATQLFRQSLHASLTADEIRSLIGGLGIAGDHVQMSSDRHWTLDWRK